jgi:hypothetical protein
MSEQLRLIVPPAAEPVVLADFKVFLDIPSSDTSRDTLFSNLLIAAREDCEKFTRTKYVTQHWLLRMDSFPSVSPRYDGNGYPQYPLPFPPFQSVDWYKYVDTSGAVQTLTRDASYGVNLAAPFYGYQLTPGGGIQPAWLTPPWARPWPPQRFVPANTSIQFRCGYGGPLTVSTTAGSAALTAPGFQFNPDDAPAITGDIGTKISIPGAGAGAGVLNTTIAAVDGSGSATLATAATVAVSNVSAWLGDIVPETICIAIMMLAQFLFEQGAVVDQALPRVIERLLLPHRNLVS